MTTEDFATELGSILDNNRSETIDKVLELVARQLKDTPPPSATEIIKSIEDSRLVHRAMMDWMNRWVVNEVSNRLRCGVWDGTAVDRVFDTIWTEQFDIAVKDRIRKKVYDAIDAVIAEKLQGLK